MNYKKSLFLFVGFENFISVSDMQHQYRGRLREIFVEREIEIKIKREIERKVERGEERVREGEGVRERERNGER